MSPVYGIDLGTTYSVLATIDANGQPVALRNSEGEDTTPSAVYFGGPGRQPIVGRTAQESAIVEPDKVVTLIKRQMGLDVPYDFDGVVHSPASISALILRKLVDDARREGGHEVEKAVITVPAYFGTQEREATREAGRLAGLDVIDILNEPLAAAFAFGVHTEGQRTVLVYDLGGGTFDATVLRMGPEGFQEVYTDGDHELGGADWDRRIVELLGDRFRSEHPDVSDPFDDPETEAEMRRDAEEAKRKLSDKVAHTVRVRHDGRTTTVELTRDEFESITEDLLRQTVDLVRETLDQARSRGVDKVDDVLLVGGSTRMPAVAARLAADLGLDARHYKPDLAVAFGAARFALEEELRRLNASGNEGGAAELARATDLTRDEVERIMIAKVVRTTTRAYGVACYLGGRRDKLRFDHLITAGEALPFAEEHDYATVSDEQPGVDVRVYEQASKDLSADLEDCRAVVDRTLVFSEPRPAGWPLRISFGIGPDGVLTVRAVETRTGRELTFDHEVE
ncbi:Hsp70 family protein [Uniformispora flossi]|uniref:Hsp70 family protein n=1 Tax=Uniformispora flossi TaxID=3390723 RepID=UPI003C2C4DAD